MITKKYKGNQKSQNFWDIAEIILSVLMKFLPLQFRKYYSFLKMYDTMQIGVQLKWSLLIIFVL